MVSVQNPPLNTVSVVLFVHTDQDHVTRERKWETEEKKERAEGTTALLPPLLLKGQFYFTFFSMSAGESAGGNLVSVDFEVFGYVQGS